MPQIGKTPLKLWLVDSPRGRFATQGRRKRKKVPAEGFKGRYIHGQLINPEVKGMSHIKASKIDMPATISV
jgi:hypothetical protein